LLYGDYCQNYGHACELLKRLELKTDVSQLLHRVGQENTTELRQLGLHDLLIMPIQRLPRYLLLLRDLLKDTDAAHPDFNNINKAISSISSVTDKVNEAIRLAESQQKLLELDRRITVNRHKMPRLIQPGRGLFKEGKLGKITSRFVRKGVRFFITTDLLIYAYRIHGGNPINCKLHFKGAIPIGTAWIRDLQDADYKNVFQVVSPKKTYTMFAETPIAKQQWLKELNSRIVALVTKDPSLKGKRGPVMVSSKTKHYQAADPRFNKSPKSIRRVVSTLADLFAAANAPSNLAPELSTSAGPSKYSVISGDDSQQMSDLDSENAEDVLPSPLAEIPSQSQQSTLSMLGFAKPKNGNGKRSRPNLISLGNDEPEYREFNTSDEDISGTLEFTDDHAAARIIDQVAPQPITLANAPQSPAHLKDSFIPHSGSPSARQSPASPAPKLIVDPLTAAFHDDAQPHDQLLPPGKAPNEQTALRNSAPRPASRPNSFMKPLQPDREPLTNYQTESSCCDCTSCTIM
jgi:hypothetical protein